MVATRILPIHFCSARALRWLLVVIQNGFLFFIPRMFNISSFSFFFSSYFLFSFATTRDVGGLINL